MGRTENYERFMSTDHYIFPPIAVKVSVLFAPMSAINDFVPRQLLVTPRSKHSRANEVLCPARAKILVERDT